MIDTITVPWPQTDDGRDLDESAVEVGDLGWGLRHIARPDWVMECEIVAVAGRGRSITVRPAEPITSPANWILA